MVRCFTKNCIVVATQTEKGITKKKTVINGCTDNKINNFTKTNNYLL